MREAMLLLLNNYISSLSDLELFNLMVDIELFVEGTLFYCDDYDCIDGIESIDACFECCKKRFDS